MERVVGRRWRAALFDLDGTLIDTRPGMRAALCAAIRDANENEAAAAHADMSLPLEAMIRSALPAGSNDLVRQIGTAFRIHYDAGDWMGAELYPGVEQCLQAVQAARVRAFILTNKRSSAANRLLERFRLASYFEATVGQPETPPPLPKSELARGLLSRAGLDPASTVVVGDSDSDAAAAASHEMSFVAFTGGAGPLTQALLPENRVEMGSLVDVGAYVAKGSFWRRS